MRGSTDDERLAEPDGWLPMLPGLQTGDAVGEFVIDAFHAEGGWSDVYRAHHRERDLGPVALKVMPAGLRPPPPIEQLTGIPHLVDVFASGVLAERGLAYVAMRLVAGFPLDRLLAAGSPPTAGRRRLLVARLAEIAGALAGLHRRGLIHGDLKPANILIETAAAGDLAGRAVLVDLGCTRPAGGTSPASTIYATLPYAAPEQLLGLDVDGRADVFALGLCLHDLLIGRRPERRGRRPAAGMEPLAELLPDCGEDLAAIVAEAVAPDPALRYRDAAELEADLRGWLAGAPPSVRPRRALARARRCLRREPAVFFRRATALLLIAAVTLGLAAAGTSFLAHEQRRRALSRALAAGDLHLAVRLHDQLGATWTLLGLPSALTATAAADGELGPVLVALRAGQVEAACEQASRLLGSDGVDRHEVCAAWLLHQAGAPTAAGRRAAAVLSHALFDNPVRDPDGPAAARLRDGLLPLLAAAPDDRGLHALAALGGAADLALLGPTVAVWLDWVPRHPDRLEALRLGIEVMNRISARCGPTAADPRSASELVRQEIARVGDWLAPQRELPVLRDAIRVVFDSWLLTLRRLHERAGRPPPEPASLRLPWPPSVLEAAIAGDPSPMLALRDDAPEFGDARALGCAAAMLDDAAAAAAAAHCERTAAATREPADHATWVAAFAAGRQAGSLALHGPDLRYAIDEGSRLADVDATDSGFTDLAAERASALPGGTLACWNFLGAVPRFGGRARSAAVRAARTGIDEVHRDSHYLGFGAGGVSALQLVFEEPETIRTGLRVMVSAQKGRRGALPHAGEAGLEIALDDRVVAAIRDLGRTAVQLPLTISDLAVGRARRLEIRLQAGSNTTVRLFEVWIE